MAKEGARIRNHDDLFPADYGQRARRDIDRVTDLRPDWRWQHRRRLERVRIGYGTDLQVEEQSDCPDNYARDDERFFHSLANSVIELHPLQRYHAD